MGQVEFARSVHSYTQSLALNWVHLAAHAISSAGSLHRLHAACHRGAMQLHPTRGGAARLCDARTPAPLASAPASLLSDFWVPGALSALRGCH